MKTWAQSIKASTLLSGAVMGAGFLSGKEPVFYFGTQGFMPFLLISGAILFVGFCPLFCCVRSDKNGSVVEKFFEKAQMFSNFIFAVAMLAGLNEVWHGYGLACGFPALSLGVCFFSALYSFNKRGGAEKLSILLMPVALFFTNFTLFSNGGFSYGGAHPNPAVGMLNALIFAFMNFFICAPAAIEFSKNISALGGMCGAALFSITTVIQAAFILMSVRCRGSQACALPIAGTISGALKACLYIALSIAMTVSFYVCFQNVVKCKSKISERVKTPVVAIAAYLFSFTGLDNIIKFVYPFVGALGVAYFIFICKLAFSFRIKNHFCGDNMGISVEERKNI